MLASNTNDTLPEAFLNPSPSLNTGWDWYAELLCSTMNTKKTLVNSHKLEHDLAQVHVLAQVDTWEKAETWREHHQTGHSSL